jgi:peroxiredoxin
VRALLKAASTLYTKFVASARQNETLSAGDRAPDFRMAELDGGGEKTLAELLAAGPVFLVFFKISCPTCQYTLPFLERMYRARGAVPMFAVSQDDARDTREFRREFGITMPTLLDDARFGYPASNAYGLSHVPAMFLIEPDRTISWSLTGFNRKELEALGGKLGSPPFQPGERVAEMRSG